MYAHTGQPHDQHTWPNPITAGWDWEQDGEIELGAWLGDVNAVTAKGETWTNFFDAAAE